MGFGARILKDSVGPNGVRLTSLEVTFPRIVLAEFNTHRMFSRNSASSRAIPVKTMLARVMADPFVPIYWGENQKGMQAASELGPEAQRLAVKNWMRARNVAVSIVKRLQKPDINLHKQIANRLLEPFMFHTVIVSSTEWTNFFALRDHKDAQPEIRFAAALMRDVMDASTPTLLSPGDWHLPLVDDYDHLLGEGFTQDQLVRICVGRCTRVSYLTHDGKRDPQADLDLAARLQISGHMSPFEHAAQCLTEHETQWSGNFRGWLQYRKTLPNESVFTG